MLEKMKGGASFPGQAQSVLSIGLRAGKTVMSPEVSLVGEQQLGWEKEGGKEYRKKILNRSK